MAELKKFQKSRSDEDRSRPEGDEIITQWSSEQKAQSEVGKEGLG